MFAGVQHKLNVERGRDGGGGGGGGGGTATVVPTTITTTATATETETYVGTSKARVTTTATATTTAIETSITTTTVIQPTTVIPAPVPVPSEPPSEVRHAMRYKGKLTVVCRERVLRLNASCFRPRYLPLWILLRILAKTSTIMPVSPTYFLRAG